MIKYIGNCEFEDCCEPFGTKNEWGIDLLQRKVKGRADKLRAFMAGLKQGDSINLTGYQGFYLQTWNSDDNPVFPTVLMTYKGLLSGTLPTPHTTKSTSERSGNVSATVGGEERTYDFSYISPQVTQLRVVNTALPGARPSVEVGLPLIIQSWFTGPDGRRRSGYPPGISVGTAVISTTETPVFGTPYLELEIVAAGIIRS